MVSLSQIYIIFDPDKKRNKILRDIYEENLYYIYFKENYINKSDSI